MNYCKAQHLQDEIIFNKYKDLLNNREERKYKETEVIVDTLINAPTLQSHIKIK